jgi:hypothetical protein
MTGNGQGRVSVHEGELSERLHSDHHLLAFHIYAKPLFEIKRVVIFTTSKSLLFGNA